MSDQTKNIEVQDREQWTSRIGFILASAGMAIGMGNIWKFPYLVGKYGGGAFVLAYLILVVGIAIPLLMLEAAIGKKVQKGAMDAHVFATGNDKLGTLTGGFGALIGGFVNFTYCAIIGYSVYYIYVALTAKWTVMSTEEIFNHFIENRAVLTLVFVFVVLVTGFVVSRGVVKGIEKACKIMIPTIFIAFGIMLIRTLTLPNIAEGINFYMAPDFSALADPSVWFIALGQAFFSVGVGPGFLIAYGSRLKEDDDIALNMTTIAFLDSSIALLAGFALIPAVIALGFDPKAGAELIFIIIPAIFNLIPGGQVIGVILFTAIFFAGLSSAIANLELPVTSFMDKFGWSRKKSVSFFTVLTLAVGIPCIYNPSILEKVDMIVGNYGYTITAAISVIVIGYMYGAEKVRTEIINPCSDFKIGKWYAPYIKYVAGPIVIFLVIKSLI